MVKLVRRLWRLLLVALWLPVTGVIAFPGIFMGRKGITRNSKVAMLWAKGCAKIIRLEITVHQKSNADGFSGMIVSNHQCYLDILVGSSSFPIRFAAKAEIKCWPLFGQYLWMSRPIWINRKKRGESVAFAKEMERTILEGNNLLVYPEGTTGTGEGDLLPFKSTAFESIARAKRSFLPIVLKYRKPEIARTHMMNMLKHIWNVLAYKKTEVDLYILEPIYPEANESRKELAQKTYNIMNDKYRSLR